MPKPRLQTITTPSGETLVVLPLADYEALVDAKDIARANAVRANIAAGRDELVPSEIVKRLLSGENPVRVWREHRGLSARDLARVVGVSPVCLYQIETGKMDESVAVLKRLTEALNLDFDDLIPHSATNKQP
jgi:DNA-binding XRE family transcriptional regulator